MSDTTAPDRGIHVRIRQDAPIPLELAFSVAPGELLALIGPSGSGKTTTLRSIAGLHTPEDGRIVCAGAVWYDGAAGVSLAPRRRRVGLVFQSYALFPHLSAADNVMEALTDLAPATRREQARILLARVHLEGLGERRPAQLSGGQRQRVAVARALARRPDALLLDEPFSAVDQTTRRSLQRDMAELRRDLSMPVILVTHDIDEVARLADSVVLLSDGKVAATGAVNEVLARLDLPDIADRLDAGTVLTATVSANDEAEGVTRLDHPAGPIVLPLTGEAIGSKVRLRVRARDVALAIGEPGRISIRNRLAATVTEIAQMSGGAVDVKLDAGGEPLVARIMQDAVRDLELAPGKAVTALIKSAALDR
jgi:molybdate transport system ATP-binding protein